MTVPTGGRNGRVICAEGFDPAYRDRGIADGILPAIAGLARWRGTAAARRARGGIEIIWDRQFGFLKETLVAPVSRLDRARADARRRGGRADPGEHRLSRLPRRGFRPAYPLLLPLALLFMPLIAIMGTAIGTPSARYCRSCMALG